MKEQEKTPCSGRRVGCLELKNPQFVYFIKNVLNVLVASDIPNCKNKEKLL